MGVSIYESAIKPTVDLEDNITVYVPGYSKIGPEEPTLCNSVSEFESMFGATPYLFENNQLSGNTAIAKGSPEKGYLYAKTLLEKGLRVLFHRVKPATATTASADMTVTYKETASSENETYTLVAQAISFGQSYNNTKVKVTKLSGSLISVDVTNSDEEVVAKGVTISLDPSSSIYIKQVSLPLVIFKAKVGSNVVDIEDSTMMAIANANTYSFDAQGYTLAGGGPATNEFSVTDLLYGLAGKKEDPENPGQTVEAANLMEPLLDFERYPSVTFLTSGGYYLDPELGAATGLIKYAGLVKANSLIDILGSGVKDSNSWQTYQTTLANLTGTATDKGKCATFIGCNTFDLTPYRLVMGDSLNYLAALGNNMNNNISPWLPVANDPNGVAGLGYDSTNKVTTNLAEEISEGDIGVSANAIIYSKSAGGYKIMGNRTLISNNGVLGPNSFLNISFIVNRVERACRQAANSLKIVSTNPNETFNRFEEKVSKTINPMTVNKDGILSSRMRMLPKTKPATINIEIHLVVLEGIEQFNIYIPYELALD